MNDISSLKSAYEVALAEKKEADAAHDAADDRLREAERDLRHRQKILRALLGADDAYRDKLLDNHEIAALDVAEESKAVNAALLDLRRLRDEKREAATALKSATQAEGEAFTAYKTAEHREVARELVLSLVHARRAHAVEFAVRDSAPGVNLPIYSMPNIANLLHSPLLDNNINQALAAGIVSAEEV